ncbi:MAG: polysaccharide deacetylase family protein [Clostridia bacterium]|nr:polysaccharide deacetylase family protein [Clostridia bacterium]
MKKRVFSNILCFIFLPLLTVGLPTALLATAADEPAYDWYFKANDTHTRPALLPEADFLDQYKDVIALGPDEKVIYLTFDAGFDNGNMSKILDTLQQKQVPAAFFVDGNFVKNEPDLVTRICKEGHILGNHSLSHADMSTLRDFEQYKEQIAGWERAVDAVGGTPSKFFRFPCGRFSERALDYNEQLGLKSVFWSFAYYDWDVNKQPSPDAALEKALSRAHNGCVMLLHSVSATNAQILPELIERLRSEGYSFKSLNEI